MLRNWAPKRFVEGVRTAIGSAVDIAMPNTARYNAISMVGPSEVRNRRAPVNTRVAGEALSEETIYKPAEKGRPNEFIEAPTRDFVKGIRSLFILHAVWSALHFIGFLILLIYRSVVVAQGTTKIITIFLVTTFSIFNSDPANHPNQFYPVVWQTSSYLVDIPFIIVFGIAFVVALIRLISIWASNGLITANSNWFSRRGDTLVVSDISEVFEEEEYQDMQFSNFYLRQVVAGDFWLRWIEWFLDGGALLWGLMTLAPIQDSFLLVSLLVVFGGVIILAFLHEHMNRVKLSNVALDDPVTFNNKNEPIVNRRSKKWWAYVLGVLLNGWIWTAVFLYLGYADNFNPAAYQWFRITVVVIGAAFFFIIIPIVILIWSAIVDVTAYNDFDRLPANPTTTSQDSVEPSYGLWADYKTLDDKSFFELDEYRQHKIERYADYQEWNKNVVYEIVMVSTAGICKHLVIWILWGGMLGQ